MDTRHLQTATAESCCKAVLVVPVRRDRRAKKRLPDQTAILAKQDLQERPGRKALKDPLGRWANPGQAGQVDLMECQGQTDRLESLDQMDHQAILVTTDTCRD